MWILKFLPDWIFYTTFVMGGLGLLATYLIRFVPIPAVYMYRTPIQICSVLILGASTYMIGAAANEAAWLARVAELEKQISVAEVKASQHNEKVVTKVVTRTQVVRERGADIVKYVDREIVKYDNQCVLPPEFIIAINRAAEEPKK